jgi:hypothetical protein
MPVYSSEELRRMQAEGRTGTDWARVKAMTDDEIDTSDDDAPEGTGRNFLSSFFQRKKQTYAHRHQRRSQENA